MQLTLLALLALLSFALASPIAAPGSTISLSRRESFVKNGVVDKEALKTHLAHVQNKYARTLQNYEANTGEKHPLADTFFGGLEKRSTASDALTAHGQSLWYGAVSIGTPAVNFTVDFDTGSSDLFVPNSTCTTCGSHTEYNPSKSSTAKKTNKTFSLKYGDGSTTSGTLYNDTVTIGSLKVTGQTLGSATTYSSSFVSLPSDGVMGLAFPSLSSYPATPFIFNLGSSLSASQFSFKLASSGSSLYIGGTDTSKYKGSFYYAPVTKKGYWEVTVDSLKVGNTTVASKQDSIVDSGSTLLTVDTTTATALYAKIVGAKLNTSLGAGIYTLPCNAVPANISVGFGGTTVTLSAASLNFGPVSAGSTTCVSGIAASNAGFWILGDVFLRNVYTTFDMTNSRVGIATLA